MGRLKKLLAFLIMAALLFQGTNSFCESTPPLKSVTAVLGENIFSRDPLSNGNDGGSYLLHAFEGLTKLDKNGKTVPGMAKSWKIDDGGKKYTFNLRDAKWSDGKQVTAYDFEYAWKKLLDPNLQYDFSYILFPVKNAEQYASGQASADSVGIYAKDDYTLEVILKEPMPYFIEATYLPYLIPLRKDIVEQFPDDWYSSPDKFITNGAFTMTDYSGDTAGTEVLFMKSQTYWDKNSITVDRIHWVLRDDEYQAYEDIESGNVDLVKDIITYDNLKSVSKTIKRSVFNLVHLFI